MSEALLAVDVLICKIGTAVERRVTVDYDYLAVVAVVLNRGDHGTEGVEHLALHAALLQLAEGLYGVQHSRAYAVIHESYIHALSRLAYEKLAHCVEHIALGDYEELKEDKALCSFKLGYEVLELYLTQRIVFRMSVPVHGI